MTSHSCQSIVENSQWPHLLSAAFPNFAVFCQRDGGSELDLTSTVFFQSFHIIFNFYLD